VWGNEAHISLLHILDKIDAFSVENISWFLKIIGWLKTGANIEY